MKNHDKVRCVWSKMVSTKAPPYKPMDDSKVDIGMTLGHKERPKFTSTDNPYSCGPKTKESGRTQESVKQKKKRKGWKRISHAALTACRYLGRGVAYLGPMAYTKDYYVPPYYTETNVRNNTMYWANMTYFDC